MSAAFKHLKVHFHYYLPIPEFTWIKGQPEPLSTELRKLAVDRILIQS